MILVLIVRLLRQISICLLLGFLLLLFLTHQLQLVKQSMLLRLQFVQFRMERLELVLYRRQRFRLLLQSTSLFFFLSLLLHFTSLYLISRFFVELFKVKI